MDTFDKDDFNSHYNWLKLSVISILFNYGEDELTSYGLEVSYFWKHMCRNRRVKKFNTNSSEFVDNICSNKIGFYLSDNHQYREILPDVDYFNALGYKNCLELQKDISEIMSLSMGFAVNQGYNILEEEPQWFGRLMNYLRSYSEILSTSICANSRVRRSDVYNYEYDKEKFTDESFGEF